MADLAVLETFLWQSHAALLSGDLAALDRLAPDAGAALDMQGKCDPATAQRLVTLARRNETLLEAAMAGIRAARRRVQGLTDEGRFSTYDSGGQRGQPGLPSLAPTRRV